MIFSCAIIISYLTIINGQSLAELAKMAGVDLKEISGAEHLAEDDSGGSSSRGKTSSSVGIGSTPPPSPSNTIGGSNPGQSLDMQIPPEFATAEAAAKPSCGNCGKPNCPECAGGKLGIGMTPDFGGQAMASGMEGMGGFPGMGGMAMAGLGLEEMSALGSAGFAPSMNGFGGGFGGYGAPAASFMSPAAFSPYGGGIMNAFAGGFENEMNPMGGGGYATFPLHAPIEPYPMRGGRTNGGRGRRPPPQQQEEQQDQHESPPHHQPQQHHYEGPSQEQGGYEQQGPPSHHQGGYQEDSPQGPPAPHQGYESGPPAGHQSESYHQGPQSSGNSGYDYEQ